MIIEQSRAIARRFPSPFKKQERNELSFGVLYPVGIKKTPKKPRESGGIVCKQRVAITSDGQAEVSTYSGESNVSWTVETFDDPKKFNKLRLRTVHYPSNRTILYRARKD